MAVVYPLANGNWSTVANWYSGGVAYLQLPQPTDTVDLNAKVILLDTNVSVVSITGASSAALINVTGGNYTINGNIYATGTYQVVINSTLPSGTSLTINGNIFQQGTNGTTPQNNVINHTGLGTINITGNVYGGTIGAVPIGAITNSNAGTINIIGTITNGNGNGYSCLNNSNGNIIFQGTCITSFSGGNTTSCINNTSVGTVTVNGGLIPSGGTTVYGISGGGGILNINGDVLGSTSVSPSVSFGATISTGTMTINGNVTQRSYSASTTLGLINLSSTGTINVTGSVSGGSVANTIAISSAGTGTINVTGNATGGSNATNTPAIYMTAAGTSNVNGITTSNSYPAIWSTVTTAKFNLLGDIVNTAGLVAYYGSLNVKCSPTVGQSITYRSTSGSDRILATTNVSNGAPVIANVRYGIVYGSTNELTGTLRMALPSDVRVSVPTDNTVGTATITAQDFWDYAVSNLTAANSIGKRLKNCSTVQTTGDQIAAF
jgi:hypothetical protein